MAQVREWFRLYKTAEGKPENTYSLGGQPIGAVEAMQVAEATHALWAAPGRTRCKFNGAPCWGMRNGGVEVHEEL